MTWHKERCCTFHCGKGQNIKNTVIDPLNQIGDYNTTSFNIQESCILLKQCIYLFSMILTLNNDCFSVEYSWLVSITGTVCVLCEVLSGFCRFIEFTFKQCHVSGGHSKTCHCRRSVSIPGQSRVRSVIQKVALGQIFVAVFLFPLLVSLYQLYVLIFIWILRVVSSEQRTGEAWEPFEISAFS